jgi:hypothetical protein
MAITLKDSKSYVFIDGKIGDLNSAVESAKKNLPLKYAAKLEGKYKLLLETGRIEDRKIREFAGSLGSTDYAAFTVTERHGTERIPHPRTITLATCHQPVRSIGRYMENGVEKVELGKGLNEENVLLHIPGVKEEAEQILAKIIYKNNGELADANFIIRVLYPERRTPITGLWKDRYEVTEDCVDLVRAVRES